jgi:ArsR family transcriptional regulator
MDAKTLNRCTARARIAKALAHPVRIRLLELLSERTRNVQELTQMVDVDQSTISKHLAILRDTGLVAGERGGAVVNYRVVCCCMPGFFDCLESVLRQNLQVQKDSLKH